jgi:hypothetical protein
MNQRYGWLQSVVSTIIAIDLTTNQWNFLVLSSQYHQHGVHNFVWPCLGWIVVHMARYHRACWTKSKSFQVVVHSLSPPPLKTLQNLLDIWIQQVPNYSGTTLSRKLVRLIP